MTSNKFCLLWWMVRRPLATVENSIGGTNPAQGSISLKLPNLVCQTNNHLILGSPLKKLWSLGGRVGGREDIPIRELIGGSPLKKLWSLGGREGGRPPFKGGSRICHRLSLPPPPPFPPRPFSSLSCQNQQWWHCWLWWWWPRPMHPTHPKGCCCYAGSKGLRKRVLSQPF